MRMLIRHTILVGRSKVHINPFSKKINAVSRKRARTNVEVGPMVWVKVVGRKRGLDIIDYAIVGRRYISLVPRGWGLGTRLEIYIYIVQWARSIT